jgi:aquaporin Z
MLARKLVTEFIGTFFLVLTVGLAVTGEVEMAAVAIGSVLMVMVYMGGHISGAHYNPAVTLAVWLRGKITPPEAGAYIATQLVAAVVAALVSQMASGTTFPVAPAAGLPLGTFFLLEFLFTFALTLVVLNVATAPTTAGNSFYGLAIGFTVVVGAFVVGPLTGGAFNPAVAVGPNVVDAMAGGDGLGGLWVYVVACCLGGLAAALVYRFQNGDDAAG